MFYPKVCIKQLLNVAWYRVITLFTLYFLVDDTSIMILALPCNRGLTLQQNHIKLFWGKIHQNQHYKKHFNEYNAKKYASWLPCHLLSSFRVLEFLAVFRSYVFHPQLFKKSHKTFFEGKIHWNQHAITVYNQLNAYNTKNMLLDVSFLQFPSFDFSCLHFELPT